MIVNRVFKQGKNKVTESLTFKSIQTGDDDIDTFDGFRVDDSSNYVLNNTYINGGDVLSYLISEKGVVVRGFYNKADKKTEYEGLNWTRNTMTHANNTNASMISNYSDRFNVNTFTTKSGIVEIKENNGNDDDTLYIKSNAQNLRFVFNVDTTGNVLYEDTEALADPERGNYGY